MRNLVISAALAAVLGAVPVSGQVSGPRMAWLTAPKHWSETGGKIEIETDKEPDFWRVTH